MKRYAVLGIIIALVVSIAAIGCSSKSSKPETTPFHTPTPTVAPTPAPTETPEVVGELPANYKFFMTWSDSDDNSGEMQYWAKGEKWNTAWNSTTEGTASRLMVLYDGQDVYLYLPAEDPAMDQVFKYTSAEAMINPGAAYAQEFKDGYYGDVSDTTMLAGFEAACSGGASIDGQEDINGQSCTKFTCNFEGGTSYTWISDSGWPVKVETTVDGKTTTVEYSNIDFDANNIPDSMFDINEMAPGVPITEI